MELREIREGEFKLEFVVWGGNVDEESVELSELERCVGVGVPFGRGVELVKG